MLRCAAPMRRKVPVRNVPWVMALGLLAATTAPRRAYGTDGVDGMYGRLRGDLVLSAELGAGALGTAGAAQPVLAAAVRARYLDMTGVVAGYDALWLGVDFRPGLLARFTNDLEHGPRWLDLLVDSIGLDLGAAWMRPGAGGGGGGGAALVLGAGVELPLAWSGGPALMLRLAGRWFAAEPWNAQGTGREQDVGLEAVASLVLRTTVRTGLTGEH